MRARLQLVREDQPTPDKAADIEVEKILDFLAPAETKLGKAGGRHIMQQEGPCADPGFDLGDDVDVVPVLERPGRQVQFSLPSGKASRHGDPGPDHPFLLFGRKLGDQCRKIGIEKAQRRARIRHGKPFRAAGKHRAVEPHGNQVQRPPPDLDPD